MDGESLGYSSLPRQPGVTAEPGRRSPADRASTAGRYPGAEVHIFLGMPAVIRSEAMRRLLQFEKTRIP